MKRSEFPLWEAVEVRWSDMDAMGHVNNARYFTYLECARIHLFETLELKLLQGDKHGVALVSVGCNFRKQVRYPAVLEIGTRVSQIGERSFHLEHAFFLQGEDIVMADAHSVVVCVNYAEEKAVPLPDALRARLEQLRGVPEESV
ncbi:MAG: acyl-CoA thioesterase [Candidatus Hydrogenedentes bacterium]|nr:acyl-CoA thioesterase [Candidatus Hydrogenedentota bacterium]